MGLAAERSALAREAPGARGCWFYLRYFFLFASLVQLLIIVGLVLFMVYGNAHLATEDHLRATERRADGLFAQLQGLSAARANLSRRLNLTLGARDAAEHTLQGARRELERINASFRQCQVDRMTHLQSHQYMAAIIVSEQQCHDQLKENNKTCEALIFKLSEKTKTLELELSREKVGFAKERGTLQEGRRQVEEQLAACGLAREQQQLQRQQAEEELGRLRSLCLALDGNSFEEEALRLWRDSVIPRTLDSYPYHTVLGGELAAVRRTCDQLPGIMSTKLQELARSLRAAIERVSRENAELQRRLQEAQRQLQAAGEAQAAARKEADAALAKAGAECAGRVQQAEEAARVLRGDRDVLAAQLDARTQDVARLGTQLDARGNALDACLRARSPPLPPVVRPPVVQQPPPLDPAVLEDFKKRVLESQRLLNAAAPPSG